MRNKKKKKNQMRKDGRKKNQERGQTSSRA